MSSSLSIYRPFDLLPNELLATILLHVYEGLSSDHRKCTFPLTTPTLVSRRWKEVAEATPALWTTLQLDHLKPGTWLPGYLERSRAMPLTIWDLYPHDAPMLLPYAKRWSRVVAWMGNARGLDEFLDGIAPHATSLKHLSIISSLDHIGYKSTAKLAYLGPSLTYLHLTRVPLTWTPILFQLPNLVELVVRATSAVVEYVDLDGLMDTLRGSPRLKRLHLFGLVASEEGMISWLSKLHEAKPVELHELEELVLVDFYITEVLLLTSQIICPYLKTLGFGLLRRQDPILMVDFNWEGRSPVYGHLKQLDVWTFNALSDHFRLVVQKIKPVPVLGIRGNAQMSKEGDYGDTSGYMQCMGHLEGLGVSVQQLHTRAVSTHTLRVLLRDNFPETETVHMYYEDAWVEEEGHLKPSRDLSGIPNVIPWGLAAEEKSYLELSSENKARIGKLLPKGMMAKILRNATRQM
ncbi:hypothetical protein FRC03_004443 [Tulasnella sp. 419]|nr:hypothetical protein FRC03_004443 [Tulasnella sp. 419]